MSLEEAKQFLQHLKYKRKSYITSFVLAISNIIMYGLAYYFVHDNEYFTLTCIIIIGIWVALTVYYGAMALKINSEIDDLIDKLIDYTAHAKSI